jgi:septal ring factor EnvC (AmiA/AmiB activator)
MPPKKYQGRYTEVYFPSEKFLEKWKAHAVAARMPLSSWIVATVEAAVDGTSEPAQEIADQKTSLQEENRRLRREMEKSEAKLRELETQIFKLQHASFLSDPEGQKIYSEKLIKILRSGGVWPGRELLVELSVNPEDVVAIQIVTIQLQALQDFGLVSENARGWKWIG